MVSRLDETVKERMRAIGTRFEFRMELTREEPGVVAQLDDLDEALRLIDEWEAVGFEYLVCGWPGAGRAQVEAFAERVLRR